MAPPTTSHNNSLATLNLYRALNKRFYDAQTRKVSPDAYLCRAGNDFNGLSVRFSVEEHIRNRRLFKWHGIGELPANAIEELGLQLDQDKEDHANIKGIPRKPMLRSVDEMKDNFAEYRDRLIYDDARAEYLAGELARRSTLVHEWTGD